MSISRRGQLAIVVLAVVGVLVGGLAPGNLGAQTGGGGQAAEQNQRLYLPQLFGVRARALDQRAIEYVASQHGVAAESLAIANQADATYPVSGRVAVEYKVSNVETGAVYGVTFSPDGEPLDSAALEAAEHAAYAARYGRFDPALAELLAANPQADVPVIIWLKEGASEPPARPAPSPDGSAVMSEADQEAFLQQVDAERADKVGRVVAPVAARLAGLGVSVERQPFDPVLYTRASAGVIAEAAQWNEVDKIYLDHTNEADLDIARQTILANTVNSRGITGSGIRVAQIEVGGRVATANPNLAGVVQDTTSVCAGASGHSTGVAGIIRSTHATVRGIAPGALLRAGGSCGGVSSELQSRSTAAADWGARAINLSWGSNIGLTPGANDRFYDSMVINRFRTIVKSAGNEAGPCGSGTGNVTSPGLAYNVITVGNFNDFNSVGWSGDAMSSCSSWRDPASTRGDREKPEIAAPGTNINSTTTASPWTGGIGSGTSFAAPMVTGAAALLIQRNSSLSNWPEAIRAILMTTAVHNIEGSGRLSELDGAGAIALDRADNVARSVGGSWGAQSYTCSTAATLDVATISLTGGVRTRAVISWDNNPSYSSYASQPSADLDLQIVNSAGSVIASSVSYDNTYEIVDFTPGSSGTYRIRVNKFRCDFSPSWLGWAWRIGN